MTLHVKWIDRGFAPQAPPDPKYPNGIDLDLRIYKDAPSCSTQLPYPAKRIGYYLIHCEHCGLNATVTTAGRVDDPRSIHVACKKH